MVAIVLTIAGAGYTAYWFHAAGQLRKTLDRWAEQRRAQGWTVAWSDADESGYPFHVRVTVSEPSLASPSGFAWQTVRLSAAIAPFDWTRLRLDAPGAHRVGWPGGEARLDTKSAHADINLDLAGTLEDATLLVSGLTAEGAAPEPVTVAGLALFWDPLPVAKPSHSTATVRFSATAHGLHLPALPGLPLDRDIALAELTGRVMGAIPPGPLAPALAQWSAEGGTAELDHVTLEWEPMALEGEGTLALDPAGQPLASLSTRVRGFGPLMDRLADARTVEPGAANAAKMVLSLLAKPDPKGRPAVPVPVSVQDGSLFLGPARIARVPVVHWE